ncbi:hypothetical protein ACFYOY_13635 [Streptomyces sp. NPDC007875]|uniref:hypothetical protein n=1 Tax=Streptomyces sp. NPDC007875 TaxID=3364783 RepID=UPI0036A723A8
MTTNHRAEAEKHLATASRYLFKDPADTRVAEIAATIGQGHATLARDEEQPATTADTRDALTLLRRSQHATRKLVSTHIAQALASRNSDRWQAGVDLAKALHEAGASMDRLIDARLSDEGWDPRAAWKTPASATPTYASADDPWVHRNAATCDSTAPERNPWGPAPDVTDAIPENVRRIIAEQLADMLIARDDAITTWARNLAYALKNEGADLTDAIKARITHLTLGYDPAEPPF